MSQLLIDGVRDETARLHQTLEQLGPIGTGCIEAGPDALSVVAGLWMALNRGTSLVVVREDALDDASREHLGVSVQLRDGSPNRLVLPSVTRSGQEIYIPTSGTTGRPKLAAHSLDSLEGRVRVARHGANLERWLLTYHPSSFAGIQVLLTVLKSHAVLVAPSQPDLGVIAESGLRGAVTHVSGTPTLWRSLLGSWQSEAPPIRQITLGGEAVDQLLLESLAKRFPESRIVHIYASTEAGALFAVDDQREGFPEEWLQSGPDGVQLRIVGGVLEVASPRAMRGYAMSGAPTEEWIRTGDLVDVRDGRVRFMGRVDSLINVGGAKVLPEEVERAAIAIKGIAQVRVFGKQNPILGQMVVMEVVAHPSANEEDLRIRIKKELSEQLAPYKVPRIIQFVAEISANAMGKKDRRKDGE